MRAATHVHVCTLSYAGVLKSPLMSVRLLRFVCHGLRAEGLHMLSIRVTVALQDSPPAPLKRSPFSAFCRKLDALWLHTVEELQITSTTQLPLNQLFDTIF